MGQLKTTLWASLAIARLDLKQSFGNINSLFTLVFSSCMGLIAIYLILSGTSAASDSRLIFLFPGLVSILCLGGLTSVSGKIKTDVGNGTALMMFLSPASPQALLFGHLLGLIAQVLVQMASLLLMTMILVEKFEFSSLEALAGSLVAVILGVVIFGSLGAVLAVGNPFQGLSQIMIMIVMSFSVIASTAYFSLDRVPSSLIGIAKINPISFICETIRFAFCTNCEKLSWTPLVVVFLQALFAILLAVIALRKIDRQIGD